MMKNKYEQIKEFSKKAKISTRTVYRFYNKNSDLHEETIKEGKKRYYPINHLKYFDSELMFEEAQIMKLENQSMRGLIDKLLDKDSLQRTLWFMEWTFFCTIAYKAERNKKSCFRQMNAVYDFLDTKYGNKTELRLFFTTEAFNNRTGYHNHFILYVQNPKLRELIVDEIQKFFNFDRTDIKSYDKYKAAIFYVSKDGLVNEDWDILTNINSDKRLIDAS